MTNLAVHYEHIEENYDLMKKYFFMAIDKNYNKCKHNYINYLKNRNDHKTLLLFYIKYNDVDEALKCLLNNNIINNFDNSELIIIINFLHNINDEHINKHNSLMLFIIKTLFKNNLDLLDIHYKYTLNSVGYEEAKR